MTDEAFTELEVEWRTMLAELRQAEQLRDRLLLAWARLNTARDQELARRKMRAQVLAELEAEKQGAA